MRGVLEAVATSRPPPGARASATQLATSAAAEALAGAGVEPDDVGMLVNASVYHDDNVMEPANAVFVQRRLGANLTAAVARGGGTFAFDLTNGACGLLSGMQVVAGFLETGEVTHGLVVAGDVDPTPDVSQGHTCAPAGAAVLLGAGGGDEGFVAFRERSYPDFARDYRASVDWDGGRHALRIREDPSWGEHWLTCAEDALKVFLDERGLAPAEVDLLVTAPPLPGAGPELGRRAGLDPERVVGAAGEALHTAGLGVALAEAHRSPAWARARRVLLLAGGAGITVVIAEYRR